MLHLLLASAVLGIAGFDPLGAIALVGAMAMRARRTGIAVLMAATLATTIGCGTLAAMLLGPAVHHFGHRGHRLDAQAHHVDHRIWAVLVVTVGLMLVAWGVWRLLHPAALDEKASAATPRSASSAALAGTGVLVGLSAFVDPAYYGEIVVVSTRHHHLATIVVNLTVWTLLSQVALVVAGLATLLGLYEPVHHLITAVQTRWARPLRLALSVLLLVLGALAVAEGVSGWNHHWHLLHR